MNKENIFRSSDFYMSVNDVLHILIIDEAGDPVTLTLVGEEIADDVPNAPVANAASDILSTSFTANCNLMENSIGYFLDVATDSAFTSFVAGYNNKDLGVDISDSVVGLTDATVYFYRFRAYNNAGTSISSNVIQTTTALENVADSDGNVYTYVTIGTQQWLVENLKTTKYADGTPIPNIAGYNDWFLPSKNELNAVYTELKLFGIGGLGLATRWSSSESTDTKAHAIDFGSGAWGTYNKSDGGGAVRACRAFTSTTVYNLRDIGPAGGWIFWKSGNDYLECAPYDCTGVSAWSNVTALLIGTTGTVIGTGQANTTAIINQAGHTNSAAKLCDDLTSDILWAADTTGAYCYYNNDIANKADYGALYNWYAVDNAHGLAPTGWRVPTTADFVTLITLIGGDTVAGGKLKEIGLAHWLTPNTDATNDYEFYLLPSGVRDSTGTFIYLTNRGYLWTDTASSGSNAYSRRSDYNNAEIIVYDAVKKLGIAVRCMRDVV